MLIEAYLGRGVAWLEKQDFWRAQEDFAVVRVQLPTCLEAALLLGKSHLGTGTEGGRQRAEELFGELYRAPGSRSQEETALWVALVYTSLRDFETALKWTDRLERSASRERLRSYLLRKLERWSESAQAAKEAIEADPDSLEAHFLLAEGLLNQLYGGEDADPEVVLGLAETSLRAIKLDPKSGQVHSLVRAAWDVLKRRQPTTVLRSEHMIDLQTRLTSAALAAGIVLSTVAVASGQEVFDDFDDGQVFDHSPVSWGPECWWSSGIYDATSGDLVLGSSVPAAASLPVEGAFFEDTVSVRTQVRIRTQEVIMLKMLNAFLLLAGRFWQERGVDAQSTGPTIWCGDADGDGELPLSDAITILHHLFTGAGEPPHCIAQGIPLRPSPLRRRRSHRRWSRTIST